MDIDGLHCGEITPVVNSRLFIGSFDSDIINMELPRRGFYAQRYGRETFHDHNITSIQDYIDKIRFPVMSGDMNVYQANIYPQK